jgi:thiol-disulfide isomerase/thioredoxin
MTSGVRSGLAALLLFGALQACSDRSRPGTPGGSGESNHPANVEFADLDRIHAVLGEMKGRPVLVNFWATWCVPCVEELPELAELASRSAASARFVGVSLDAWVTGNTKETEEKVRQALAQAGISYLNLIYQGDQDPLLEGFQMPGPIPYSVLYDGTGKQTAAWSGTAATEEIRQAIAKAGQ